MGPRQLDGRSVAAERDGRTREVEGASFAIGDHFDEMWIGELGLAGNRPRCRPHPNRGIIQQQGNCGINHRWIEQRFVPLQVDNDRTGILLRDFGSTVGCRRMTRRCHARDAAKTFDGAGNTLIVRGDDDSVYRARGGGATIDMFDHGLAGDVE